jgi:hypothetical protein
MPGAPLNNNNNNIMHCERRPYSLYAYDVKSIRFEQDPLLSYDSERPCIACTYYNNINAFNMYNIILYIIIHSYRCNTLYYMYTKS